MSDPITRLQEDVAAILGAESRLSLVTVEQEQKGTVQQLLTTALRGVSAVAPKKAGLVVIVDLPEFKVNEPDSPILDFTLVQTLTLMERPLFNRSTNGTQLTAAEAVEICAQRLQHRFVGIGTLMCQGAEPMQTEDGLISGYTLSFKIRRGLDSETRAATPLIDITAGSCTLTGASHAGEVIYYTTDGSAPVPGAAATVIYSGSFAVTSGQLVRASSIATGYTLSDFSELEVNDENGTAAAEPLTTDDGERITTDDGEQITA